MPEAVILKNKDNINYSCNICTDNIEDNQIIGLKCNPHKHVFCYNCILDWYLQIKKNKTMGNYTIKTMCPICRNNGGLLPCLDKKWIKGIHTLNNIQNILKEEIVCGYKLSSKNAFCKFKGDIKYNNLCKLHFNKSIKHILTDVNINNNITDNILDTVTSNITNNITNNTNTIDITNIITTTSDVTTDINNSITTTNITNNISISNDTNNVLTNNTLINPNKLAHQCGVKLKNKDLYCKFNGNILYGGFCGHHKIK